jgi:hypothetical protein
MSKFFNVKFYKIYLKIYIVNYLFQNYIIDEI